MSSTNTKNNKEHCIKFMLGISCFSRCKCFYVLANFENWENIIHFWIFFALIGKKTYFFGFVNDTRNRSRFYSEKNHFKHKILLFKSGLLKAILDVDIKGPAI